jgi:hypothetical protein
LALQPYGGYVGIGTSAISYPLSVNGSIWTNATYFSSLGSGNNLAGYNQAASGGTNTSSFNIMSTMGSGAYNGVTQTGDIMFMWNNGSNATSSSTSPTFPGLTIAPWSNITSGIRISPTGQLSIGTGSPASCSILNIASTTSGVVLPCMTTSQKTSITSPVDGLQVYDTTLGLPSFYSTTAGSSNWLYSGMFLIASYICSGSSTGTVTFSSIPSVFNHLKIICFCNTADTSQPYIDLQFNGDTGNNYSLCYQRANPSSGTPTATPTTTVTINAPYIFLGYLGTSNNAATPQCVECFIPCYTNTSFYKGAICCSGYSDVNGASLTQTNGTWRNTAAITSVILTERNGNVFYNGSSFYLYGII